MHITNVHSPRTPCAVWSQADKAVARQTKSSTAEKAVQREMEVSEVQPGVRVQFRGPEAYYGAEAGVWGTITIVDAADSFRVEWDNGKDCFVSRKQVWPGEAVSGWTSVCARWAKLSKHTGFKLLLCPSVCRP